MGIFIPGSRSRARNRKFDYEPRFYDPKKDENIKRRMRVQSKSRKRRKPSAIIPLIVMFLVLVWMWRYLPT